MERGGFRLSPFLLMLYNKIEVEFPRIVYPKIQVKWDGVDYNKLESLRVETYAEFEALKGEFVLNFKEVTNKEVKKPVKKQTTLEV